MKKCLLICCSVLVLALMVSGCATVKTWFCSNETVINDIITKGNNTITTIETAFPGMVPIEFQAPLDLARALVAQGEAMLAKGCPTDADVTTLESIQAQATSSLRMAGTKTMKALRKP